MRHVRTIGRVTRVYDVTEQSEREFYDTLALLVAGEVDHERDERNARLYLYDVGEAQAEFIDNRLRTLSAVRKVARERDANGQTPTRFVRSWQAYMNANASNVYHA